VKLTGQAAARFLAKPDGAILALLLYGPNASAIEERARAMIAHVLGPDPDPLSISRLTDEDLRRDKARLGDELAAQSLLGGARLVRVRLSGAAGADSIVSAVEAFDRGEDAAAFLLVEAGELSPSAALRTTFEGAKRAAALPCYEDDAADLADLARQRLQQAGIALEADAETALLAGLPDDRALAGAEIEKLALFAHGLGRPITADEVMALGVAAGEGEDDFAARAVLSGATADAERLLARSESRGVMTLKAMERRLLRLLEAQTMVAEGASVRDVGGRLRPPVIFPERDLFARHLRDWPAPRLRAALAVLWAAETAAKRAGAPAEEIAAAAYRRIGRLRTSTG
jgi:DNA polymerase-3 subunit delta